MPQIKLAPFFSRAKLYLQRLVFELCEFGWRGTEVRVVVVEGAVTSFREGSDAQSDYYCRYGGNDGHVNSKGHGGCSLITLYESLSFG